MTNLRMSEHGSSFATRERAAAIVRGLESGELLELDLSGVIAVGPAFADALLDEALARFDTLVISGSSGPALALFERAVQQRHLAARVSVRASS